MREEEILGRILVGIVCILLAITMGVISFSEFTRNNDFGIGIIFLIISIVLILMAIYAFISKDFCEY